MIDFRYHLVSIVAIFLALAVGIVMGTTLLQEPAVELAKKTSDELANTAAGLRADVAALRSREAGSATFTKELTPQLVEGELTGQRVLLVEAPGANANLREQQQQVLAQAGAVVGARITFNEQFVNPARAGVLDGLVTQLKPDDMTFAPSATVYDKVAQLLAATVMTSDPAQVGTANPSTAAVLTGLETFISVEGDPNKRSSMAVMFAPEKPYEGDNADAQAGAIVSLAGGLDAGGKGAVLTGSITAVGAGGAITELRDTGDVAKRVSTVDTLDMPEGRVVGVYALREQLTGHAGQYGIGTGSSTFMPATPTPTPTSSGS